MSEAPIAVAGLPARNGSNLIGLTMRLWNQRRLAVGLPPERARAGIRFSLARANTLNQVDAHLRRISPTAKVHANV